MLKQTFKQSQIYSKRQHVTKIWVTCKKANEYQAIDYYALLQMWNDKSILR